MGKIFEMAGLNLAFTNEQLDYNTIRKEYEKLAIKQANEFTEIYNKENKNLDDVAKKGYEQGSNVIAPVFSYTVQKLI